MGPSELDVDALRARTVDLEARVEDLTLFTSLVAHDLDAPARRMEAFARLLADDHAGQLSATGLEYLHFVESGAHRLRELLHALLDYSRLGAEGVEAERVDVDSVLAAVVAELEAELRDLDVTIDTSPIPAVLGNAPVLGLVFRNVVRSAVRTKSGDEPLTIRIAGRHDDGGDTVVIVCGTGDELQSGNHGEESGSQTRTIQRNDARNSHSLGLASAARLVLVMGGRAWVTTEVGVGSQFHLHLPAAR